MKPCPNCGCKDIRITCMFRDWTNPHIPHTEIARCYKCGASIRKDNCYNPWTTIGRNWDYFVETSK